jgi:AraC-like DNA-binding protein
MPQRQSTVSSRQQLWEDASAFVLENHGRPLDLDEVARALFTSRRQLQRVFEECGKTSFRSHLHAVRMHEAARLLGTSPLTVRSIAERVGYGQPAQFAKAFRRHHGMSPSEFRARERSQYYAEQRGPLLAIAA